MNIEMVKKELENILSREERAKHFYDHYIGELDDAGIKKELISIRNDEIMHIGVVKKLMELVS